MKQSNFQFSDPNLIHLNFHINDDFDSNDFESIKIDGSTRVLKSKENNVSIVEFTLKIGEEDRNSPFYIEAVMKADFKWDEKLDAKIVENMLSINAPSLIVGYMRPIIANITNMSQYPIFNLPFLNMQGNEADIVEI